MDGKRGPAPEYQEHDNPVFTQDPYSSDNNPSSNRYSGGPHAPEYSGRSTNYVKSDPAPYGGSAYTQNDQQPEPITTDPYSKDFGPRVPPIVNPYGYEVGPNSRHAGYGQYAPSDNHIITLNGPVVIDPVPNYFGLALFVTLFCCWPLGLRAIGQNSEAKRQAAAGNISGARASAESSKKTSIIGIISGMIFLGAAIGIGVWYYYRYSRTIYHYYD